nr:leucine-rich repeat-containing protein 46 [Pelodiscus sinensis]|eukprot:XP_025041000.1 leucine-rich repeat-containing protein 46 [Pelodiscus sinensis]
MVVGGGLGAPSDSGSLCLLPGLQQSPPRGGGSITDSLIDPRNLPCPAGKETTESISKALASLLTVRLDRENIRAISNLQGLREVRSLYLQQNQIETIENLSCLPSLRFLSLAGNRIHAVENLRDLKQLQFLDLSQNRIETLDSEDLPRTLLILNLSGNGCTSQNGYRELVLRALPRLLKLDAQLLPSQRDPEPTEEEPASEDSASEEEADFPELTGPFCADKGDQAAAGSHFRPHGILLLVHGGEPRQSHLPLDCTGLGYRRDYWCW